jgi:hypothetical protein
MSTIIPAYPLQWPIGWKRARVRGDAKFHGTTRSSNGEAAYNVKRPLTIGEGLRRVRTELERMGIRDDDIVVSTNLPLRLDGLPRGDVSNPADPGAAVYWRVRKETRCMAIDEYRRVADNLAAIAATLEAMRAIERHGGAAILDRAFTGFTALPAPPQWWDVLGVPMNASADEINAAYRRLASEHHPDRFGGDANKMADINNARDWGLAQVGA